MDMITLYGYAPSPFVKRVAGFLYYKELPFELVPVNLWVANGSSPLL
jgi:glutathione S-transferase